MSMAYRVFIVFLVLAAGYGIFEIVRFTYVNAHIDSVKADFLIRDADNAQVTIVEFLDYRCGYCKALHGPLEEVLRQRDDIRYIARPLPVLEDRSEEIIKIALAAGLQGYFWEFHDAFLSNPNEISDAYIRETAGLYGVAYEQLMTDAAGEEVADILQDTLDDAAYLGVASTPSLFIGNVLINNFSTMPDATALSRVIDAYIKD